MPIPANASSGLKAWTIHGPAPSTIQSLALDGAGMLELHEWLNRRRFTLFGDLRLCDQQDAVGETFIPTLEFAGKIRDPGALYGACFTIGWRVRAQWIAEYIRERCSPPGVVPLVPWHPERHLSESDRRAGVLLAIRTLPACDRELLQRFYFNGQTPEQIRLEMRLTVTQFRLRKSRAMSRVRLRARAILAHVHDQPSSGNRAALPVYFFSKVHYVASTEHGE